MMAEPDVVVIGSGPCGAAAATELVRAGHRVTMLDAGRRAPHGIVLRAGGRTVFRWVRPGFTINRHRPPPGTNISWVSSLSLGGLTNYWTGAVPRYAPADFEAGTSIDERLEWPITYDDLVPFYESVEAMLEITRGSDLRHVPTGLTSHRYAAPRDWNELAVAAATDGYDLAPLPMAKGSPWMAARRPREFTSYHCMVRPLEAAANFNLVRGARVLRLNYAEAPARVESVTFADLSSGTIQNLRGRCFVVAAGVLDSTEILLRSVSPAFPTGLGDVHGVLGRYLHDHPREWWPATLHSPMTALHHPMYVAREDLKQGDHPMLSASLTIGFTSNRDRLSSLVNRRVPRFGVQVLGTMIPRDEPGVRVRDPRSDDSASGLVVDLSFDDDAVGTVLRARERFVDLFDRHGRGATIGPFHDLVPGSSTHLGGSVRMHRRPDFGVLDAWNRLHYVPNVIVCDSSCFTTGAEKNPTLTAMAIAARAGRRLADELQ